MLYANRVKETTTTTGTGNLTLAGAATNFQTFNTAFGTGKRFIYWIIDSTNNVWETGEGYLSASTTLVRETVHDNSSNTTAALTLSAGTKDVICSPNQSGIYPGWGDTSASWMASAHTVATPTTFTVTTDRVYLVPFLWLCAQTVANLGIALTVTAGTKLRCGVYDNLNGQPTGSPILETADITPAAAFCSASVTNTVLPTGWYWAAFVCDGAATVRAANWNSQGPSILGMGVGTFNFPNNLYYQTAASWTVLPTIGALNLQSSAHAPQVNFGV